MNKTQTQDTTPFAWHTLANDYTTAAQLARVSKWLGAIPAFGDSIGTETSKAQLGCAKRIVIGAIEDFATMKDEIAELKASNAVLVSALETLTSSIAANIDNGDCLKGYVEARSALSDARKLMEGGAR